MLDDHQFSQTTKVAVVRDFAVLRRDARRIAKSHFVSVASVYRWKDCPELIESAVQRTSIEVLRAELMAAEVALHWMGMSRWVSSVRREDLSEKAAIIEALRGNRLIEQQVRQLRPVPSIPREAVYEFIRDRMSDLPTAAACNAFEIARSGYYAWLRHGSRTRDVEDKKLRSAIAGVVSELGEPISYRRISESLRIKGIVCSRHRVKRLLECPGTLEWMGGLAEAVQ
ncbi:hypothetical protein [Luteimonas saliphila]|uniref:hypothetical protein n=1 Tax=Luteimonas saliphila TaxID=2804919 RepID=UPI00192D6EB5|nr:hypothetical protein [Luteimonas saliphila]